MKILIIGAGPIGCYAARLLKQRANGLEIEIIEEHDEIGKPVHCAGLVSRDVFSQAAIPLDDNVIINHIDGAEFFLDGDSFNIERKDVALVIDRQKFDCAIGNNLQVKLETRCVGIEKEGAGYLVETDKGEYYADLVIGADGANSTLRKIGGFKEEIEYLRGVQFRIKNDLGQKNFVRVYLRNRFFAWLIPEGNSIVRAGIISDNPYHGLSEFLKEISVEGEILEKYAGVVPLGRCATRRENLFLVGDAACQVKPLTHGGIYYGMRCAEMLVDCIIDNRTSDYEKLWQAKFGRDIEIGLKIRRLLDRLGNDSLAQLFNLLKSNKDILQAQGDFESHSKTLSLIIKNPRLQGLLGKVFLEIIKDILT